MNLTETQRAVLRAVGYHGARTLYEVGRCYSGPSVWLGWTLAELTRLGLVAMARERIELTDTGLEVLRATTCRLCEGDREHDTGTDYCDGCRPTGEALDQGEDPHRAFARTGRVIASTSSSGGRGDG